MRALITGATGLIGNALLPRLEGASVVVGRDVDRLARAFPGAETHAWPAATAPFPSEALCGTDVIFHLAGEPIAAGRWTEQRRQRIRDSRVLGTRALVNAIAASTPRPGVLIAASAVGFYGDRGDEALDEGSPPGRGFLAELCAEWEAEARSAEALGVRVVNVRFGAVLATHGGALQKMLPAFRLGVGGRLGHGRQWMSCVHVDDAVGLLLHARDDDRCRGPMNAVSPRPLTNLEFTQALGRALGRPTILPIPALALRLMFGEMSHVLIGSQRVYPRVAERSGFRFEYPTVDQALTALLPHR